MKIGPRYKIARRLGAPIFEKTQTQKFAQREQSKSAGRRPRRRSDYGLQLLEKQKARLMYGVTERQFRNYVRKAMESRDVDPTAALHQLLESRLDNVVYRAGLAPSRRAARQRVSHGHFTVNGTRTTVPSFHVTKDDVIAIRQGSLEKPMFANLVEEMKEAPKQNWLSYDAKKHEVSILGLPEIETGEMMYDVQAVVEFYSR